MKRKTIKKIKYLTIFFFCVLICEIIFVFINLFSVNNSHIYFESINSVISNKDKIYAVGSNNDNSNFKEKAKISFYNSKKEILDEKIYNKGFSSVFFDIVYDNNSLVTVGSYEKSDDVRKAMIVKYDLSGNILFDNDFEVLNNSKFTSIYVVDDGYVVCGQSVYSNTRVGSSDGGAIIVKYDKDGNIIWSINYGNNKESSFNDVIVVGSYIYAVGYDRGNYGIICKYDLNGNFISDYKLSNSDEVGFTSLVSFNNTLYVCGSVFDNNIFSSLIVNLDYNLNYIGNVNYNNGDVSSRFDKIILDKKNNLVVIGNSYSKNNIGNFAFIGKYSLDLKKQSIVNYNGERDDFFSDVILFDKGYLVVGFSLYEDDSYLSKFIIYSDALKILKF